MPSTRSEEDNYNCFVKIMNVAVCEGLREIFKQEWDKHYGATKGVWDDTCISGNELYNMERTRLPARSPVLNLYKSGKRSEWDCTALVDAVLYSNTIKRHLAPCVSNKINELRVLRNNIIHNFGPQHAMPDAAFDNAYRKVKNCFKALKLSSANVEKIVNYSKGKHLSYICLILFIVGLIFSLSYYWFINAFETKSLFRHIPTKPVHDVANRTRTVNEILEKLHNLSIRNNRALTYLYISGNPGSGKSQLARLVGQRYGTNIPGSWFRPSTSIFVMTLNGRSLHAIYESYADFARRVGCGKSNIASIINSNVTTTVMKIKSLQTEIAEILKNYKGKWLLIVDNVVKLGEISSFFRELEKEDWRDGQVLITTQDMSPRNDQRTVHMSVSEGMDPAESCEFLTGLSGLAENQDLVSKVAEELDYQPLALASAAFYVAKLRESKASSQFTWKDYLKKLDEGKRNLTETKLCESNNASYSLTMSTAVLLAVKMFAESDTGIKHAFTFLSYVSHEPLSLDVVVSYVLRVDKNEDREDTRLRILQCSLILPLEDDKTVSISLHRVVHDSIKLYIANVTEENTESRAPFHVLQLLLRHRFPVDEIALKHLKAFYAKTKNLSLETFVPDSMKIKQEMQEKIVQLASGLTLYGEFLLSKKFLILAVEIATDRRDDKLNFQNISYIYFPKIGVIFSKLGYLEEKLGNETKSREYHEWALKIFLKQYGRSHEYVAISYINLGHLGCTEDPKECSEGIKYYEQVLEIDDQPEIKGAYYADQGFIHYNNGDLLIAKMYYFLAAKTFVKTKGLDESYMVVTHVAASLKNIGCINWLLGLHEETKRALRLSIKWYLRGERKNHIGLAETYYDLGFVHFALNELPEAEDCLRSTLKIYSEQLEPSHEKICKVSAELAGVLNKTGQLSEAADLDKAYADICRR